MRILIQHKGGSTTALEVDDFTTLTVTSRVSIGVDQYVDRPVAFPVSELAAVHLEDAPKLEAEPTLAVLAPVEVQPSSQTVSVEDAPDSQPDEAPVEETPAEPVAEAEPDEDAEEPKPAPRRRHRKDADE